MQFQLGCIRCNCLCKHICKSFYFAFSSFFVKLREFFFKLIQDLFVIWHGLLNLLLILMMTRSKCYILQFQQVFCFIVVKWLIRSSQTFNFFILNKILSIIKHFDPECFLHNKAVDLLPVVLLLLLAKFIIIFVKQMEIFWRNVSFIYTLSKLWIFVGIVSNILKSHYFFKKR